MRTGFAMRQKGEPMDLIESAIDHFKSIIAVTSIGSKYNEGFVDGLEFAVGYLEGMSSAQPETCEGCKHLSEWKNEVEYGHLHPCILCKRRVDDLYER